MVKLRFVEAKADGGHVTKITCRLVTAEPEHGKVENKESKNLNKSKTSDLDHML